VRFAAARLPGAWVIELERNDDQRGHFARIYCEREFASHGLPDRFVQSSLSFNRQRGTVRGLHFQWPPSSEGKVVRCVRGAAHDVMIDLRPASRAFLESLAVTLSASTGNGVYIPPGFAHGFQTLEDDTEVLYQMSDFHAPELAGGYPFDDPAFAVAWPLPVSAISDRDRTGTRFSREHYCAEYARRVQGIP
jgi:dTDP-4-dehydrorhamnose 3,5-epimerase